jgi:predicted membrane protein
MAGLFFAAAGLLLTADNLDLLDAEPYLRLWPGLLVVVGVFKLLDAKSSRLAGIAFVVVGAWILALNLNWIRFTIFDFWPLIMIGLGLALLARAFGLALPTDRFAPKPGTSVAFFSQRKQVETSQDYRGGSLVATLGGQELDLSGAGIGSEPAVLDVFAMWGGIEIIVPDDWEIVSDVTPVMAGFEARGGANADPKKRLVVRGAAIMAGIDVRNAARRQ